MIAADVIAGRADEPVDDRSFTDVDRIVDLIHARVIGTDRTDGETDPAALRSLIESVAPLLSATQIDYAVTEVGNRLHGLGPLEVLMADPAVDEIMVNGPGPVWVERRGALMRTPVDVDDRLLQLLIERIIGPLGLRVDRTAPFVDARLADGSRVNIAVPPLAIDGPYLTIRRFRPTPFELGHFCPGDIAALLGGSVQTRKSMIICGGTGSGKTSLLNALARHITPSERVITIEDAAELRLPGDHVVRLESRPPNAEGVGAVSVRTLVRNALRMRPDRLIIGEVRGGEALDMLQAMNTGHEGSMSTCHANSPEDALRRLEAMVLMSDVDLPVGVVRDHLTSALHLIVHVERASDGLRRVRSIRSCAGGGDPWLVHDGELTTVGEAWRGEFADGS